MHAIKAITLRYTGKLAAIVGVACILFASPLVQAAYRDGQLAVLNMSDGYVTLSGDSHRYPLSIAASGKLWRQKNSGAFDLKPGMRVRLDLKPQPGNGEGGNVVMDIVPLRGGAK